MPIIFKNPSRRRRNASISYDDVVNAMMSRGVRTSVTEEDVLAVQSLAQNLYQQGDSKRSALNKAITRMRSGAMGYTPASRAKYRGASLRSSLRKSKPYFNNPMLEIEEEIDDLPIIANPRMRRNMTRDNSPRRALMAKYRKKYGPQWASNEKAYVEYFVERKQNSGSTRSVSELKQIARENFQNR